MTVEIPLAVLNRVRAGRLRLERARAPRGTRHRPDQDAAEDAAAALRPRSAVRRGRARTRRPGRRAAADRRSPGVARDHRRGRPGRTRGSWTSCPPHLRPTFRVLDEDGEVARRGQGSRRPAAAAASRRPGRRSRGRAGDLERTGLRSWEPSDRSCPAPSPTARCRATRRWSTRATSVAIRVLGRASEQEVAMRAGTRRLLLLTLPNPTKPLLASDGQREQAGADREPARFGGGAARRLRRRRGRRARRPARRAGLGRGGVRRASAPVRRRSCPAMRPYRPRARSSGSSRVARGVDGRLRSRRSAGTAAVDRRPARAVRRAGLPGLRHRDRRRPPGGPAALPDARCSDGWTSCRATWCANSRASAR